MRSIEGETRREASGWGYSAIFLQGYGQHTAGHFFLRWPAIQPSAEPPTQVGGAASGWGWSQEGLPSRSQVWLRQTVVSNGLPAVKQPRPSTGPMVVWANRGIRLAIKGQLAPRWGQFLAP